MINPTRFNLRTFSYAKCLVPFTVSIMVFRWFVFLRRGSHIAGAGLELALSLKLALNARILFHFSSAPHFSSAEVTGEFVSVPEAGFLHVVQAGFKLPISIDPPASVS